LHFLKSETLSKGDEIRIAFFDDPKHRVYRAKHVPSNRNVRGNPDLLTLKGAVGIVHPNFNMVA